MCKSIKNWKLPLFFIGICFCVLFFKVKVTLGSEKELYQESLKFDKEGNLLMTTHDKAATSGIRYKTLGWTIKRYSGDGNGNGNNSVRLKLESNGISQIDPENPEYIYSYFICSKEMIFEEIAEVSQEWMREIYEKGGTLYLDAIMTVVEENQDLGSLMEDGTTQGEVYFTRTTIETARNWADSGKLQTHFNKSVYFPGNSDFLKGSYEEHYLEVVDMDYQNPLSLSRLGLDLENQELKNQSYVFSPKSLESEHLKYMKTRYVIKTYQKIQQWDWTRESVQIHNESLVYQKVKIYYYFQRENLKIDTSFEYGKEEVIQKNQLQLIAGRGENPVFDINLGIPTGEELCVRGKLQSYYGDGVLEHNSGMISVPVNVNVTYTVMEEDEKGVHVNTMTEQKICYVTRNYSYYRIKTLHLYLLEQGLLWNQCLSQPQQVLPVKKTDYCFQPDRNHYIRIPAFSTSINGGILGKEGGLSMDQLQMAAEAAAGEVLVRNDELIIGSDVFLNGDYTRRETDRLRLPSEERVEIIKKQLSEIPHTKKNQYYETSGQAEYSCEIFYQGKEGDNTKKEIKKDFEIHGVNGVRVHTPVVCNGWISDDISHNQQLVPTKYKSLVLGRNFGVSIGTYGSHRQIPGYGTRDYEKYVLGKQVCFPFPVYRNHDYVMANTWVVIEEQTCFFLPAGVDEGDYQIQFRSIARNVAAKPGGISQSEMKANLKTANYVAVDEVTVTVTGRMYDLAITNMIDYPRWKSMFYMADGVTFRKFRYRPGKKSIEGEVCLDRQKDGNAPVLKGDHLYNQTAGPLGLGYRVKMELRTMGSMREAQDTILFLPVYYYISRDAKERIQVKLYKKKDLTQVKPVLRLTEKDRSFETISEQNVRSISRQSTSVQLWKGEYQLPPDVYLVAANVDIDSYIKEKGGKVHQRDRIFKRDGYLLVQFYIISNHNGTANLVYYDRENENKGYCNMWKLQGFLKERTDGDGITFHFQDGDFLIFDIRKNMYTDYISSGTH